jgi:surface protein
MFFGCVNLANIDLSSFKTKNLRSLKGIFNGCQYLKEIDLSSFDIENVTKMEGMFVPSINILTTFFLGGDLKVENNKTLKKIKVNKKSYEKFCKVIDKESLYVE